MTTAAEWKDLARRAREATGPDREIDVQIAQAAFPEIGDYKELCAGDGPLFWHGPYRKQICPNFTASIDAIVALIGKTLPGHDRIFSKIDGKFSAEIGPEGTFYTVAGSGASEALALVAAYCEARTSTKEKE